MSDRDPRDRIKCACPRIDGKDCARFRAGDDMRELYGDPPLCDDDEGNVVISQEPGLGLDLNWDYIREHRLAD